MRDLAYLKLLSREYPNIRAAASDIINLQAICGLPKGTEYFFSDLHGEHEAFIYLLRSSSGIIREKIRETFGHIISEEDEVRLANLIYYPEKMINQIKQANEYTEDWQKTAVYRLVQICREVSSKYTRSKVRKKMPKEFSGVIDELLYVDNTDDNKTEYYSELINTLIDVRVADSFIVVICSLIRSLTIDNLHILGDIFDRGPRPDIILEELMHFHDVDIQWGNHDISWMGAADMQWAPIDLYETAKAAMQELTAPAELKNVSIRLEGTKTVIQGIPQLVSGIVFNLMDNAVKYNKDGGLVIVRLGQEKNQAVLTVTDTGIGIRPEHQERVFERFYRVDKSHSKEIGGTGLGLSIVKHAALILGAAIELDSTVGKGTIVTVRFPMEKK